MTASSDTPDPAAFVIAIPARLAAARLPEKPLRLLGTEPLIRHVARRAMEAGAADVAVAGDDARILDAVADLPVRGVLTARGHASGTDRLAECARLCGWPEDTVIVNLQGDEPFAPAAGIRAVAQALVVGGAPMATLATPIADALEVFNPNVVKVVTTTSSTGNGRVRDALYFSRAPIPWDREHFAGDEPTLKADTCLRHIGIYAYRNAFLQRLAATPQGVLECIESLEQLRALEAGHRINVALTPEAFPPGVDTPEDLARAEQFLTSFTSQNA